MWFALLAIVCSLALYYGFNVGQRWLHRDTPGPKPDFFTGNMLQMGGPGKSYLTLQQWAQKYGRIFVCYFGRQPAVVLTDPELIKEVGLKKFAIFHDRALPLIAPGGKAGQAFTNNGMLFARGTYWASLRAACSPLFHKKMLNNYASMISDSATKMVDILEEQSSSSSGKSISVQPALSRMTMDVIGETAFGLDFGAQQQTNHDKPSDLLQSAHVIFLPFAGVGRWVPVMCFAIPELKKFWWWLAAKIVKNPGMQQFIRARNFLWAVSQVLLENIRMGGESTAAEREQRGELNIDRDSEEYRKAYALYQGVKPAEYSLINKLRHTTDRSSEQPLTDLDVCAQSFTFLLAGYETTSLALSYVLYEISKDVELQRRLQEEVDNAAASGNARGDLEYNDLVKLPLCEATFYEGMRMWPPASSIVALTREAKEKTTIGGHRIIKGDRVMFNIYALHHDPKYFPEPESFKPERFLDGTKEGKDGFIPFGIGPRKCIGYKLAMEEGMLALAKIMQRFDLELDAEKHTGPLKVMAGITLVPVDGIWIKFKSRGTTTGNNRGTS